MSAQENGACVLIVDDEPDVLHICDRALSKAGYRVFTAATGRQARQYLGQEQLDLVVLDIYIPDEDGISLLKYVHEIAPQLPVMLITGYAAVDTVIDAIRLRVTEYLCKPFTLRAFLAAVESSLSKTTKLDS
jgi:DNA-binding NtrC family response regulator